MILDHVKSVAYGRPPRYEYHPKLRPIEAMFTKKETSAVS